MPGKQITEQQIRLYMTSKNEGKSQLSAAAKAGVSERSARRIDHGELTISRPQHSWRTRSDPLENVWQTDLVPLLEKNPGLYP